MPRKPEIMSPAGYWPQLRAAIEAGADAVYFGLKHFSARAKVGFSLDELSEVMQTLHRRGVKGYVTFNTLVFEHELITASETIRTIAQAGADALIVQDLGISRLARSIAPGLELHASTQMSITDSAGVRMAQSLGLERVTLARELSLDEIRTIYNETKCELEMFVHGALCVAYSGQCFSSEAWGGRSANRGQCAQACRLPYELLVDGEVKPLADARYLLSPGDLYTVPQVPEMIRAGVAALKIEGRYKDAAYVALTTSAYRKAVDEAWAGRPNSIAPLEKLQLEQVYSRGLGAYFVQGTDHQAVVKGRAPRHRGVLMGRVISIEAGRVAIEPCEEQQISRLKPGDGIVFDAADWRPPEQKEEGSRIYGVIPRLDGNLELSFGNGAIDFDRIRRGDLVWRTDDPDLDKLVRPYTEAASPVSRQTLRVLVEACEGEALRTEWQVLKQPNVRIQVSSLGVLDPSRNQGLSAEFLREHLGRLGNTPYELVELELKITGSPFAPASMLNQLRREAVEKLQRVQGLPRDNQVAAEIAKIPSARALPSEPVLAPPELHLLVRTPDQLDAALNMRVASITLDYLDLYGIRPAIEKVKSRGIAARVASPRLFKPGESRILNFLLSLDCAILVRASGMLHSLSQSLHPPLIGDFSLNAANSICAEMYLEMGLLRITPAYDLNADQIADLARRITPDKTEVVAYQHLPVFHTEHCVFCRFLSTGKSFRDCGRPCETTRVALKDQAGRAHPVLADVGCRNTVFGAEAQEASAYLDAWRDMGASHFRLEFVHESPDQLIRISRVFSAYLAGTLAARQLREELKTIAPQGTSDGSLFVPREYLTLPVLQ